jgi:hypothetical protein
MRSETFVSDNRKRSAVLNIRAKKSVALDGAFAVCGKSPSGVESENFLSADVVQQKGKCSGPPELLTACFFRKVLIRKRA